MSINKLRPLSGAETEVIYCLFLLGPTEDGNMPSKCGRDDLFDPTLNMLGTNDQPGDYRSSGCSACHVPYANDRSPVHSGSYAQFGKLTSLPDVPAEPPHALEMVRILVEGHEGVARTARALFPVVDKASDEPSADLLTQRLDIHEKTAWMLRSLLEE